VRTAPRAHTRPSPDHLHAWGVQLGHSLQELLHQPASSANQGLIPHMLELASASLALQDMRQRMKAPRHAAHVVREQAILTVEQKYAHYAREGHTQLAEVCCILPRHLFTK
jgi:hypothetical protein